MFVRGVGECLLEELVNAVKGVSERILKKVVNFC